VERNGTERGEVMRGAGENGRGRYRRPGKKKRRIALMLLFSSTTVNFKV